MDAPKREDFSTLDLYLRGAGERIQHLMEESRSFLEQKYKDDQRINWGDGRNTQRMAGGFGTHYEDSLIWSWAACAAQPYTDIVWGFRFPTDERVPEFNWDGLFDESPRQPFALVGIGVTSHTEDQLKGIRDKLPESRWKMAHDYPPQSYFLLAVAHRPLDEFLTAPDIRRDFVSWVEGRFVEACEAIGAHDVER